MRDPATALALGAIAIFFIVTGKAEQIINAFKLAVKKGLKSDQGDKPPKQPPSDNGDDDSPPGGIPPGYEYEQVDPQVKPVRGYK